MNFGSTNKNKYLKMSNLIYKQTSKNNENGKKSMNNLQISSSYHNIN